MIPWLNIRFSTAAVLFAATLGGSFVLTRAQMMWPNIRGLTGGSEGGLLDRVTAWFSGLFG